MYWVIVMGCGCLLGYCNRVFMFCELPLFPFPFIDLILDTVPCIGCRWLMPRGIFVTIRCFVKM